MQFLTGVMLDDSTNAHIGGDGKANPMPLPDAPRPAPTPQ